MEIRFFRPPRHTRYDGNDDLVETWLFGDLAVPYHTHVELWRLDDERRKVGRALWLNGRPIVFDVGDGEELLEHVLAALGEGLYRLVARGQDRKRVAQRDLEVARAFPRKRTVHHSAAPEVVGSW